MIMMSHAKIITRAATQRVVHQFIEPFALYNAGLNHTRTSESTIQAMRTVMMK